MMQQLGYKSHSAFVQPTHIPLSCSILRCRVILKKEQYELNRCRDPTFIYCQRKQKPSQKLQSTGTLASPQTAELGLTGTEFENVFTRFTWPKIHGGSEISIWGSFNGWTKGVKLHKMDQESDACVIMPLKPGTYEFKYVVDKTWLPAPHEPMFINTEGHLNNCRVVAPTVEFSIQAPNANLVLVVGDWDDWQYAIPLKRKTSAGLWSAQANLPPNQFSYKFVVDDRLTVDWEKEVFDDADKGKVHKVWSNDPTVFRFFYCTGWDTAVMVYKRFRKDGTPITQDWQRTPMANAPSRGHPLGMWKMAAIVPAQPDEYVEFYLSSGDKTVGEKGVLKEVLEDRAPSGGLYQLPFPGSFKLIRGMVRPFPRGNEARMMLVSDIDGTMIGDVSSPDAFTSSSRFAEYWESGPALTGSLLVYNTGRSLGQFVDLMRKTEGRIAIPDVLITAIGTKIWVLDEPLGRSLATGLKWREDKRWTATLDRGWNLGTVRKIVEQLVRNFHDDEMLQVLDNGTEHPHRLALTTHTKALEHTRATLKSNCESAGLSVRIIVSGSGSHRYVDIVPRAAGKEKALQYVRAQAGVPEHLCPAAGDSGNDVLMLGGAHPGIVVGNAQPELLSWLVKQPQDGRLVYADAFYAEGVMEGLARHGLM